MSAHRNFGLDLARALAIVMVFLSHGVTPMFPLGCGVDLFFVLSGFLIGRIYLRSQAAAKFTLWGFWQARWFRTLPPYFAALGLFVWMDHYFHSTPVHLYYLVFLQNYLGVEGFGPSWSLCVEEHFYLALPLLGFVILRILGRRSLLWLLPIIALIPQLLRSILFLNGQFPSEWYFRSHYCAEGLVLGVWLAYVFVDRPELWLQLRKAAVPLALLPLGSLVYIYLTPALPSFFQATLNLIYALGFAAWVRLFYDLRWSPAAALSRLMKVAIHGLALSSYSIYLVHTLIFTDVRLLMVGWSRGAAKSSIILISTLLISIIFYFLVERPTIQLRDRLLKKPRVDLGTIHSASLRS